MRSGIESVGQSVGRIARGIAVCAAAWLLLGGCQTASQNPPATQAAPGTAQPTGTAHTQTITLTWDQQNNCVNFSPSSPTINVGDHVQFNSSLTQTVTIRVDAAAFGAADTVITVARGANQATHDAQTPGTYMWHSTPTACSTTSGGPGPSVVIDEGMGGTKK